MWSRLTTSGDAGTVRPFRGGRLSPWSVAGGLSDEISEPPRARPLRIKGETEVALHGLPVRTVMLRPGGVRPVPGTGTRHALLKPLYWGGAPLMKLASAIAPSLMTSNLALGQAMIALAGREHPPATVECADINRIAAGLGDPAS